MAKVELIVCDQCGHEDNPGCWEGIEVIDRGSDPEERHFCSYQCLADWAQGQADRWDEMANSPIAKLVKELRQALSKGGDTSEPD